MATTEAHPSHSWWGQVQEILAAVVHWRPPQALGGWLLGGAMGLALAAGYLATQKTVALTVDDETIPIYTHRATVREALREAGVTLAADDTLIPPLDTPLYTGQTITIYRPFTATVIADGDRIALRTRGATVEELLCDAGVTLGPHDVITVNGQEAELHMMLRPETIHQMAMAGGGLPSLPVRPPAAVEIAVRRAVPLTVYDDGAPLILHTVQANVGDALRAAGVLVYQGDKVSPGLGAAIAPGMRVAIQRATPLLITADGLTFRTRTQLPTLGQALEEEGLRLEGQDRMEPAGPSPVQAHTHVRVIRVREVYLVDEEPIPYKTVWRGDPGLEIDHQRLDVAGVAGVFKRMTRIVYEDGAEVQRGLYREWTATEPITRVIAYGTQIVVRDLTLPDGTTVQYWRKMRAFITTYNSDECKPRDHPEYGVTYLGWRARPGIVAVDPQVINLRSKLYIPGYGVVVAGDTGVWGRSVDVYMEVDQYVALAYWDTVYLLTPVPPRNQIRWILPSYPTERPWLYTKPTWKVQSGMAP